MSVLRGRTLAMYIGLCVVWGSTWLGIKIGLQNLPPLWFAGIRMALACVLLTPFAFAGQNTPVSPLQRRWVAWSGLLQIGVSYACIFLAEQHISSGLAALLFAVFPIFVGVFAHFMLPDEPLTPRILLSAVLGLTGVAVIEAPAVAGRVLDGDPAPDHRRRSDPLLGVRRGLFERDQQEAHGRRFADAQRVGTDPRRLHVPARHGRPFRARRHVALDAVLRRGPGLPRRVGHRAPVRRPLLADPPRSRRGHRHDPGRRHVDRGLPGQPRAGRDAVAAHGGRRRAHPPGRVPRGDPSGRVRVSRGPDRAPPQIAPRAAPRIFPPGRCCTKATALNCSRFQEGSRVIGPCLSKAAPPWSVPTRSSRRTTAV